MLNKKIRLELLILALLPISSVAQVQTLVPGVNIKSSYNDNISLARDNGNKQDDFIIEVNPYIAYRRDSKGLKLNVDYQLQTLTYTDQSENNDIFINSEPMWMPILQKISFL